MRVKAILFCEAGGCGAVAAFGGPNDGFDVSPEGVELIRNEALSMGWTMITNAEGEYMFCSGLCAAKWLKEAG